MNCQKCFLKNTAILGMESGHPKGTKVMLLRCSNMHCQCAKKKEWKRLYLAVIKRIWPLQQPFKRMAGRLLQKTKTIKICGLSASGRDLGFEFLGSALHRDGFSIINYELAIFNGYKLNTTDNNKSKDIVGRLIVTPVKPLSLFGYFQRGEGAYPTFNDVTQKLEPQDTDKYLKMFRYGGGFSYTDYWGFARAEFIGGKTGNLTGDIKSAGGYFAAGANIDDHWKLVARYDYIDENVDSKKINEMDYTAGITYAPLKNVDLKLNYTYRQLNGGFQDKNCVYLQLTIKF